MLITDHRLFSRTTLSVKRNAFVVLVVSYISDFPRHPQLLYRSKTVLILISYILILQRRLSDWQTSEHAQGDSIHRQSIQKRQDMAEKDKEKSKTIPNHVGCR